MDRATLQKRFDEAETKVGERNRTQMIVTPENGGHDASARLLVPTGYDEPDIIGPFTSYEDAVIRTMVSRELEILHRRESEEIEALKGPHN
jgi:hypothetical protein